MLCTAADVKTLLGFTHSAQDAPIGVFCQMASDWLAAYVDALDADVATGVQSSLLEYFVGKAVTLPGHEPFVRLQGFPVVAVTEVVAAGTLAELDTLDPLVANDDYRVVGRMVERLTSGRDLGWPFCTTRGGWVRVTYSGGYWPADADPETTVPVGWLQVPTNKRQACAMLAMHLFKNKDAFGQRSINVGTAVISEVVRDINVVGSIRAAFDHLTNTGLG